MEGSMDDSTGEVSGLDGVDSAPLVSDRRAPCNILISWPGRVPGRFKLWTERQDPTRMSARSPREGIFAS